MTRSRNYGLPLCLSAVLLCLCGYAVQTPAQTREYRGVPADRAILACERVLYSFTDAMTLTHQPDGMRAAIPGVTGGTPWEISVVPGDGDATRVVLRGSGSPGLYRLFHARLMYVLELRPDYLSCADALRVFDYEAAGAAGFAPLCALRGGTMPTPLPLFTPEMPRPECNECP